MYLVCVKIGRGRVYTCSCYVVNLFFFSAYRLEMSLSTSFCDKSCLLGLKISMQMYRLGDSQYFDFTKFIFKLPVAETKS